MDIANAPGPSPVGGLDGAQRVAPMVGMDPADVGAYMVVLIDRRGMLRFTGTENIPPDKAAEFLQWAADELNSTMREAS
jgi:hypothetical protein